MLTGGRPTDAADRPCGPRIAGTLVEQVGVRNEDHTSAVRAAGVVGVEEYDVLELGVDRRALWPYCQPSTIRSTEQRQGGSAMTEIPADQKTKYKLERRYERKKGGKPLSGYAHDLTIRFNAEGTPFVDDQNGDPLVFNTYDEMKSFLDHELERNYTEFFGKAP